MCRFVLYMGPPLRLGALLTEPANSLINQSFHSREREEPLNGDGFGVAWFKPSAARGPAVFHSISPAWNNRNLRSLARVVESPVILAHVRAAPRNSAVSEANCHPFQHDRHVFMHNGEVGGFADIRRDLVLRLSAESFARIEGSTDSEHVFALFLDRLAERSEPDAADAMAEAMRAAVREILVLVREHDGARPSYLNLAVSDGLAAVVTRVTTDPDPARAESLHLSQGRSYVCEGGVCRLVETEPERRSVLVASEPLTDVAGWETVAPNHLLKIRADRSVAVEAFGAL
jgi:glutamine amidotransferase